MSYFILVALLIQFIYGGAFIPYFGENSSSDFKASALKAIHVLSSFIELNADVNVLFVQEMLEDGVIAIEKNDRCRDSSSNFVYLPPALYAQKYDNFAACNAWNASLYYHIQVSLTTNPTFSFFVGDDMNEMGRNQYDMTSTLLHELLHGLGIETSINHYGLCQTPPIFSFFDLLVFNLSAVTPLYALPDSQRASITNNSLFYYFDSHQYPLYSKNPFWYGTSVIHGFYGVMNYKGQKRSFVRTLDAFTINIFNRMGYKMKNCDSPDWSNVCGFCTSGSTCIISGGQRLNSFFF